ncbi:MAG: hypothetical protein SGILL_001794 [Bacillariaceae sp.]
MTDTTFKPIEKQPVRRVSLTKPSLSSRDGQVKDTNSKINYILSQLSHDELETAARACYEYMQNPMPSQRHHYARRIAQRYLESKKGNVELALEKVKKTLAFRKEIDIDSLITAFDDDENDCGDCKVGTNLEQHLSSKKYFVQGYDKEGRSTLYFIPRLVQGHDLEWTVKEAIYSIERAIACSKAKDHTINAVVDFSGFSMTQHSPPLEIGKQFLTTLRSHYAGQINRIYLTDTPFSFSVLWKIFSPFVGTNTRDKIHFVNGTRSRAQELTTVYNLDQVPAWLVPGGKNNRPLDVEEYLHTLAFDQAFNERN